MSNAGVDWQSQGGLHLGQLACGVIAQMTYAVSPLGPTTPLSMASNQSGLPGASGPPFLKINGESPSVVASAIVAAT